MNEMMTVKKFAGVMGDKPSMDKFIRRELKAYLPEYKKVNIYFYKDLIEGKKKVSI
jgi:hypothetical protein